MRGSFVRAVGVSALLAEALVATGAAANSAGAPGYSGKPNAAVPQGETCVNCHAGANNVSLTGPDTLAAGATGDYTFVVTGSPAGADIAATNGVKLTAVSGLVENFDELVQPSPQNGTFRFKLTAPLSGTAVKIWAAGHASGTGQTTKTITITGGAPPVNGAAEPDPDAPGPAPPPYPTSTSGGGNSDAGTKPPATAAGPGAASEEEEGEEQGPGNSRFRSSQPTAGGCSSSPMSSVAGGLTLGGAGLLALIAAVRRRRRA